MGTLRIGGLEQKLSDSCRPHATSSHLLDEETGREERLDWLCLLVNPWDTQNESRQLACWSRAPCSSTAVTCSDCTGFLRMAQVQSEATSCWDKFLIIQKAPKVLKLSPSLPPSSFKKGISLYSPSCIQTQGLPTSRRLPSAGIPGVHHHGLSFL